MLVTVAQALFFFLPAYFANMCPVLFGGFSFLRRFRRPIDGGMKLVNSPLFGNHKTYFGFVAGVSGAFTVGLLQLLIFKFLPVLSWLFLFPYTNYSALLLAVLLGFGALFGDLMKSFLKRRLSIPEGKPFYLFDQLDFVAGGLLFGWFVYLPSPAHILILVILTPLLHFLSNVIGYKLGLKKVWW
jgi:CDP-2,3-bis-(O-geranylgeranyl)-sn-glycerol synthase